jgi:hypothetical protein
MSVENMLRGACLFLLVVGAGCSVTASPDAPAPGSTCEPDDAVTMKCTGGNGYSCTGSDTPDQTDPTLICSVGEALSGNETGLTGYCCVTAFASTVTCAPDPTVTGCVSPSIGFSCTGSDTPDDGDMTLICSCGVGTGPTLYCCQ